MEKADKSINEFEFLFEVLKRYDQQIASTNYKVALMLSFLVTTILGLSLRVMALEVNVKDVLEYNLIIIFVTATLVFAFISIFLLIEAVTPNISSPAHYRSVIYFGDVANRKSAREFYQELISLTDKQLNEDLSAQVHCLAQITQKKYSVIRKSSRLIKVAVIPLLLSSLALIIWLD